MINNIRNISGGKNSSVVLNSMTELIILLLFIYILIVSFLISKTEEEVDKRDEQIQFFKNKYENVDHNLTVIIGRLDEALIEIKEKDLLISKLRENVNKKKYNKLHLQFMELKEKYDFRQEQIVKLNNRISILIGKLEALEKNELVLKKDLVICQNELDQYQDYCSAEECNSLKNQVINLRKKIGFPSCLYSQIHDEKIEPLYLVTIKDNYMTFKLLSASSEMSVIKIIPQYIRLPNLNKIDYSDQKIISKFNTTGRNILKYARNNSCQYFVRVIIDTCDHKTFNKAHALISRYFLTCNPGDVEKFKLNGCNK